MNATVESLPNCLATLKVEVGSDEVHRVREKVIQSYLSQAHIPGFRPGKSPRPLVEKRFKKEIGEQLESDLLNESLQNAIREKNLRIVTVQNVDDVVLNSDGLSFSATLVTVPDFDLPDYKGIAVKVPPADVPDTEVEAALENLRARMADFVDLSEDRGAAMEDFIVVDYVGTIGGKPVHEAFPKVGQILSENQGFWIRMTDEAFFPGFCAHLTGARPGYVREFQIEAPADFPVEGFGGQKVDYKVTLKEIKVRVLPELDDAFANQVASVDTLEKLRELVRKELEVQKKAQIDSSKRDQAMEHLLVSVECELPEDLSRAESRRVLKEVLEENQRRGVTTEMLRENEKELVASAAQTARNRVKGSFILSRIAEAEKLFASRDDLLERVSAIARRADMSVEKAIKEINRRRMFPDIEAEITAAKALDFVVEHASVTVTEPAS